MDRRNNLPETRWAVGDLDSPLLPMMLRVVGAAFVVFFLASIPIAASDVIGMDSLLGRLLMWGHGGLPYIAMLGLLNAALGAALFWSARDPVEYRHVINVFLFAETAHIGSMAVMACHPDYLIHWVGDVLAGLISLAAVAIVWLPVRSAAAHRALSGRVGSPSPR